MLSSINKKRKSPRSNRSQQRRWKSLRILLNSTRANFIPSDHDKAFTVIEGQPTVSTDSLSDTSTLKPDVPVLQNVQKALVVQNKGEYSIRDDFPMPHVGDNEVMIRTCFVGLNPIDWKSVDYNFCLPSFPWVTGRETSGEVVQLGNTVKGLAVGQTVWTSTYYRDIRAGCFQEYVVVPQHTVLPVPKGVSMEEAACFGVAALTACMTLWKWLGVPFPTDPAKAATAEEGSEWLLIWGGSTVTGQFATQIAVRSGIKVVTVNSSQTFQLSRDLGANHVVVRDGKTDDDIVEEIRSVTSNNVTRAIDLVGHKTASLVLQSVSRDRKVSFAPLAMMSADQRIPENVTVHTVEMKAFVLDAQSAQYAHKLNSLLSAGLIKSPSLQVLDGGFEDIINGLDTLKKGRMGGKKLVVRV